MRYYLTLVSIAVIKKRKKSKAQQVSMRMWKVGKPVHCFWEYKLVQSEKENGGPLKK